MPRGGYRPGAGRKRTKSQALPPAEAPASAASPDSSALNSTDTSAEKKLQTYAAQFSLEAIDALLRLGRHRKTPAHVRVASWREILDRGNGRPAQAVTGKDGGPILIGRIVDELHP